MIDKLQENERAALVDFKSCLNDSKKNIRSTVVTFTNTAALVIQALDRLAPAPRKSEDFIGKMCRANGFKDFTVVAVSHTRANTLICESSVGGHVFRIYSDLVELV